MKHIPKILMLPWLMVGWLLGLLSLILYVTTSPQFDENWFMIVQQRAWVDKLWRWSTTIPGLVLYKDGALGTSTENHEEVHERQLQDCIVSGLVFASLALVCGSPYLAIGLYVLSPCMLLVNMLTAGLRYGFSSAYRQAEHERAAYDRGSLSH